MVFCFKYKYLGLAAIVFFIELFIALYVKDTFVRPYGGDILAVLFVYYLLRTVIKSSVIKLVFCAFIISLVIEFVQYFKLIGYLGITKNSWLYIIIGASFSWGDILCYIICLVVY